MANSTELALVDLFHVHLVGFLGHLEGMIMTGAAFFPTHIDMELMAEENRFGALGLERPVATSRTRES